MVGGITNSDLLIRSLSEGLWVFRDPDLQQGTKHVLVVMAPDRANEYYRESQIAFGPIEEELDTVYDIKLYFEDTPDGYLHEKFSCAPDEFKAVVLDKNGDVRLFSNESISRDELMESLLGFQGGVNERNQPSHSSSHGAE